MLNAYCGPLENTAAFTRGANTNAPAARADVTNPVANPALSGAYGDYSFALNCAAVLSCISACIAALLESPSESSQ